MKIYLLHHVRSDDDEDEDVKLIGAYSTRENADGAVRRLRERAGFRESPAGFHIDEYELDKDHWTEGFV